MITPNIPSSELDFLSNADLSAPEPKWRLANNVLYRFGLPVAALYCVDDVLYALIKYDPLFADDLTLGKVLEAHNYKVRQSNYTHTAIEFFHNLAECRYALNEGSFPENEDVSDLTLALYNLHNTDTVFPHRDIAEAIDNATDNRWLYGYGVLYREGLIPRDRPLFAVCYRRDAKAVLDSWEIQTDIDHAVWLKLNGDVSTIIDVHKMVNGSQSDDATHPLAQSSASGVP